MKIYFLNFLLILTIIYTGNCITYQKAVCIVPIADLVDAPTQLVSGYSSIPLSVKKFDPICPRLFQVRFNDVVDVMGEQGSELLISLPHIFYQRQNETIKNTNYWSLKKNFMLFKDLQNQGVDISKIPQPISFTHKTIPQQPIVSLIHPFYDLKTKRLYSIGTRFVIAGKPSGSVYNVYSYSPFHKAMTTVSIPSTHCIQPQATQKESINNFVHLMRSWAHIKNGFIPYVLGGNSATQLCTKDQFKELPYKANSIYQRDGLSSPYGGMDCAGLIASGAQAAGIPFYYKNSLTIALNLRTLREYESIEDGDIIWFLGHVVVVSSVKDGLLVEARSYEHGYGKVHEIPLNEQFKGINTYQDLLTAYFKQQPLSRLDKQGEVKQIISSFKILKLSSAWHA